jgi:hypothetical protein
MQIIAQRMSWRVAVTEGASSASRNAARGFHEDVGTKAARIRVPRCQPADFADGVGGDDRDARFVEDAVVEAHHLDGRTKSASDIGGKRIAEQRQFLAFRCQDMRRKSASFVAALWREENEVGEPAGGEPGKTAPIVQPAKGEAPVAIDSMQAQRGGVDLLTAHGFHRIAENRLDPSDMDRGRRHDQYR